MRWRVKAHASCIAHRDGARARATPAGIAAFGNLTNAQSGQVGYSDDAWRFMGSTFDPSGLYRFNAVMRWLADERITPGIIHVHAKALQHHFLRRIGASALFEQASLVVPPHETTARQFPHLPDAGRASDPSRPGRPARGH